MKESLATEHDGKLVGDTLPCLLDGGRVTNKDTGHLDSPGWDITDGCLQVVGDPFDKVRRVLVDHLKHLVVNLFAGHGSSEHHCAREVSSVARIGGAHHVLGIECLGGELGHRQDTEPLGTVGGQGGESDHEKVETRERNHVDGKLSEIAVQLTGESERAGCSGNGIGNQVVEVAVGGVGELESAEANVVQGFVIEGERLVGVLNKLVNGESGVVGLDNGIGNLRGGNDTVCANNTVGIFLLDLGYEKSPHTRSGTSSHGVGDLETLENFASLGFLAHTFHDAVYEFGSLCVVTLGPVISSSALSKDEVVGTEEFSEGSRTDGVHGAGFQIGKDRTRDVSSFLSLVEVNADSLQLKIIVADVGTTGVNAVLGSHNLPEFGSDLVTTLTSLYVNDFSHLASCIYLFE
mmetsp:Transcript_34709/g.81846  ORF Transcript_34709/g.81846 Transcript_34709/m.81846 type:complete len:406 (+) Transcript_34709:534-1751(+)